MSTLLEKHVRSQRRGFKDDEKMLPYTKAGVAGLRLLLRKARTPVSMLLLSLIQPRPYTSLISGQSVLSWTLEGDCCRMKSRCWLCQFKILYRLDLQYVHAIMSEPCRRHLAPWNILMLRVSLITCILLADE